MLHSILETASSWIIALISSLGYGGVYVGMMIESASIPLPSEIIMGFSGYLVFTNDFNLWLAALAGAVGNISGSTIMYAIGKKGGRPIINKYGKYLHITHHKMEKADKWFSKYGDKVVFFAQLLPVIRTFISLPAGILRINYPKFILYTFTGAFIWCWLLAYIGFILGENWKQLSAFIKEFEVFIIAAAIIVAAIYIYKRIIPKRAQPIPSTQEQDAV